MTVIETPSFVGDTSQYAATRAECGRNHQQRVSSETFGETALAWIVQLA